MAILVSRDRQQTVELRPYRFENDYEDWVLTRLSFHAEDESYETSGAFLERADILTLQRGIGELVDGSRKQIQLDPTEPCFCLAAQTIGANAFEIEVSYQEASARQIAEIEPGQPRRRVLRLIADSRGMRTFAEGLMEEVERIRR